jgi:hypothetical protein
MTDQIKLLNDLAKKLNSVKKTKKQSMESLINARILNKNGKLTSQYSNLNKLMSQSN